MTDIDTSSDEFKAAVEKAVGELGLTTALGKEKDRRIKATARVAELEKDAEELERLRKEATDREAAAAKTAGDWEQREAQLKAEHDKVLAKEREIGGKRIGVLEAGIHDRMIEAVAVESLAKYAPDSVEMLKPHVVERLKVVEDDGSFRTVVVNEKGETRLAPEAKNASDEMTPDQLVVSMSKDRAYAHAFPKTGATGGGSASAATGSQSVSDDQKLKAEGVQIL